MNVRFLHLEVYLLEPVSYCHHHIERSQEENKVEEEIAVHCAFLFIVNYSLTSFFFNLIVGVSCVKKGTRSHFTQQW